MCDDAVIHFEVAVIDECIVGWIGRVYYRYNLAAVTEPSDDWRIAALDAVELVEQRLTDQAWARLSRMLKPRGAGGGTAQKVAG